MSTPKRVILIVVRCIPVVVALGFLVFYVGRAQVRRSQMLSSSKNLRALSTAADVAPYLSPKPAPASPPTSAPPPPAPSLPAQSPAVSPPPVSSSPDSATNDNEAGAAPFLFGISSERPVTLGGSKSMVPMIETSDLLRLWPVRAKTTQHTFGLPPVRILPSEITFGDPSIRVQIGSPLSQPPQTSPATPEASPALAPSTEP